MATVEFLTADCIKWMNGQPADRFDLVFGSPPYCDARTYGIGAQRDCVQWVDWMLEVTTAAARICKGPVIWVAAGVTRKRNYWPACEGLMWEWWKRGGEHQLYRPCVFHRVGIPGSGGKDWFRADWEYVMCFKRPGALPWADNTACGHPPKWAPGGEMSHRMSDGTRVNQWGHPINSGGTVVDKDGVVTSKGKRPSHVIAGTERKFTGRLPTDKPGRVTSCNESGDAQYYIPPALANPGNVFRCEVGGGVMGNRLCHENEAPFPEKLAEIFVRSCCPPEGWCLDPFSGSGTTAAVCQQWGRNCIGVDLRESQTELGRRRTSQRLLV